MPIDNLISLNDYTLNRLNGSNNFQYIQDDILNIPIDLPSRNDLNNIANIEEQNNSITSIIIKPRVEIITVPFTNRFFKFKELNDQNRELFLLITSSQSASPNSITVPPPSTGLYAKVNPTNPDPFVTSTSDYTNGLTQQIINIRLIPGGLTGGDMLTYNGIYLDPSVAPHYGNYETSYTFQTKLTKYDNILSTSSTFGFNWGGDPTPLTMYGLMPNTTYPTNYLTYCTIPAEQALLGPGPNPSTSKIYNFSFTTGNTGIKFSGDCVYSPVYREVFLYEFTFSNLQYITYPSGTVTKLVDDSSPYNLSLEFGAGHAIVTVPITSSVMNLVIGGFERGIKYQPKMYLVLKSDDRYISNSIFLPAFTSQQPPNIGFDINPITNSYSISGTLTNFDIWRRDTNNEVSIVNFVGGFLEVVDGTAITGPKHYTNINSPFSPNLNLTYRNLTPDIRNVPITLVDLEADTTYNNLNIRYYSRNQSDTYTTAVNYVTSTGYIQVLFPQNCIVYTIPPFTTLPAIYPGQGITGIPYITNPTFYNSTLNITKFDYFKNDTSNSYPRIYGGTVIVSDSLGITYGSLDLSTLRDYPLNISIPLNQNVLQFNQNNNLTISYQWTDLNNNLQTGTQTLTYSALINADKSAIIDYNHSSLYSKIITYIDGTNYIGDMPLNDLQCDLKLVAVLENTPFFLGTYSSGTLYNKYDCVIDSSLTNLYWLEGSTSSIGNNPSNGGGWVNITNCLPTGYTYVSNGGSYTPTTNGVYENSGTTYSNIYYSAGNIIYYYDTNYGYYATLGTSYSKTSYTPGGYQVIFDRCFPNMLYNISYIRAETTLADNSILILNNTQIPLGITTTLNNLVYADSLTGSTSTYFTMNNIHYQNSQDMFTLGNIYLNGNTSLAYPIASAGITFNSLTETDYFTYQPQISISKRVFDQSAQSPLFYPNLSATSTTVTSTTYKTANVRIDTFNLLPALLDPTSKYSDYLVVEGPTGYTSQTFNILDISGNNTNTSTWNLILEGLTENTAYSAGDFKIYFKDRASNNRISNSFLSVPAFLTKHGLHVSFSIESGINNMYLTLNSVSLNDTPLPTIFTSDDIINNSIKFYLYVASTINDPLPIETDYRTFRNNLTLPCLMILPSATQNTIYDTVYVHYKTSTDVFEQNLNI